MTAARYLCVLAVLALHAAMCDVVVPLAQLDTQAEVDQFCSRVLYSMAEPLREPRTQGTGSLGIRFFAHPSIKGNPTVLADARGGGLRYSNWVPYQRLAIDLMNRTDEPVSMGVFVRSGEAEYSETVSLEPGKWQTFGLEMSALSDAGLDLSAIDRLGFRALVEQRRKPARIAVDNLRLIGRDVRAIREAKRAEDERNAARPMRGPRRTDTVLSVVRPVETGKAVKRCVMAPVVAEPEVLVVGGGLAGVAAAVTAARMGVDTLLVERSGNLGGMATSGLVPPALSLSVSEGIVKEFVERLEEVGGRAEMWNPEIMQNVLLTMMRDSGARLMLYTLGVDAIVRDATIRGVIVENKSGAQAIMAKVVIDCTGDGDIAARAGAPFEIGRGRDQETQTQTLVFLLGNVDTRRLMPVSQDIPEYVRKARAEGNYDTPFATGAAMRPVIVGEHGVVNVNMINIPQVSGLKVEDLTYAHVQAQRSALEIAGFFRQYVPGCEGCYLLKTAEYIGVRESRRIIGQYYLTGEEALAGAQFKDAVARGFYPIDIHNSDGSGDASGARPGRPYEIPYGCLVPLEIDNLLVAGRCISADHVAHGSLRVMGTTMPLGEAAGCAAAMAVAENKRPRALQGARVGRMLKRFGALPRYGKLVPDNLALAQNGTRASADSTFGKGGYTAESAIDGLVTTGMSSRWLSADTEPPHWLRLDFAEPKKLRSVTLFFFTHETSTNVLQYAPTTYEIQVKDADGWKTVARVDGVDDLRHTVEFAPATAKTMRVLFTGPSRSDNIIRLREIVVQ